MFAYSRGASLPPETRDRLLELLWERVRAVAQSPEPGTDPALVVADRRLPPALYWGAVREVVAPEAVRRALTAAGARWRTHGSDRGLVGASAAIAWPGSRATWELTTYRTGGRQGTPRAVDRLSVRRSAARFPELFLCEDPRTRRLLVAPHTACPVLFGLRATRPGPLLRARAGVRSEPVDRWMLFRTNQASGDHLVARPGGGIAPFTSARLRATVRAAPEALPGGHVRLPVRTDDGADVDCLAFEPTKTLPRIARALAPGDRLLLWGSRAEDPTFRLEGIRLVRLAPRWGPPSAPPCAGCGRALRSLGRARGYRCPGCRRRFPPEIARPERRSPNLELGDYHPTPSARRHLAPLGPAR